MKMVSKVFATVGVVSVLLIISATTRASPAQDACETNSITSGEVGEVGSDVPSCGNTQQHFTSADGSYGSTGCTNAWIVETPNPNGYDATFSGAPSPSYYPTTQTLCGETSVWIVAYDGEGDGALYNNATSKACTWAGGIIGCDCTKSFPVPTGTHSRLAIQVVQNSAYVPAQVWSGPGPC
jgi:hypothetical protein